MNSVNKYYGGSVTNRIAQDIQNLPNKDKNLSTTNGERIAPDSTSKLAITTPVDKAIERLYDKYDTSGFYNKIRYDKDLNIYIKYKIDRSNNQSVSQFPTEQQVTLMQVKKNILNIYL